MDKKLITYLCFYLLFSLSANSQSTTTIRQVIEQVQSGVTSFNGLTIIQREDPYLEDSLIFDHHINFENCVFPEPILFYKISSRGSITFENCLFQDNRQYLDQFGLSFQNCTLGRLEIIQCTFESELRIFGTKVKSGRGATTLISESQIPLIRIDSSQFSGIEMMNNVIDDYSIARSKFFPIGHPIMVTGDPEYLANFEIRQDKINNISIINCIMNDVQEKLPQPTVFKIHTACDNFNIQSCAVNVISDLRNLQVSNQFVIEENTFSKLVILGKTTFSEVFNIIPFQQFEGNKVSLVKQSGGAHESMIIQNQDSLDVAIRSDFLRLIRVYQNLLDIYKQSGDLSSWNIAYQEKKNLETRRLNYDYSVDPTFEKFFQWRLNQFILHFSDFGTNPAKAVRISMYVILIFSFIYFLFPSEWDKESKSDMMRLLKSKLKRTEKTSTSTGKLLRLFSISIINAITLSINSFTTLGFGNIPTVGFARYAAIFQGFIGWFLLSIFTVALINQVLF